MTEESYTDDADVSQLEHRIDELEETIRKMLPSRREALGIGVAGLAGASLMSGTASAGSAQVGTIGDASNLVDLVAEDVTITDTLNTASISSAAAGEALLSDGSGNLTFGSGGGGILRNGSEIDYVALDVSNLPAATGSGEVALVTASDEYVEDTPINGTRFDITSSQFALDTSINTQDSSPRGVEWNDDGSRLYEVGSGSDNIYQSTVSTPFDISTASFDTSINTQDSSPSGIAWNDDGSRLYEVGSGSANIYQSTVSTPFDISSASFSTSINTQDSLPTGIAWNDDGSRLYEVGASSLKIYQSTVSTPFDISSASFSTSINTQDPLPLGIAWNDDGSRLYEVGRGNGGDIYQYTVSTPFDISSASFSTSINSQGSRPQGIAWNNDGSRFYELGNLSDTIKQFTVTTGGWEAF